MHQLAKLRWQCRRGTKELDFLLLHYLDSGYLLADEEEKALFAELLTLEDDELIGVLLGELEVEAGEMKVLVERIKTLAVAKV
ncbi:MAG: succinate dehydrogenase assembly factor 2 [Methylococcales bacterium]|nr:succinate dehydrogenase assembly factor 2 [Methylococcales bacterium]MDD5633327.1 succinate dehydrogenase assembly factor 2 [Methylococcales bacterium]